MYRQVQLNSLRIGSLALFLVGQFDSYLVDVELNLGVVVQGEVYKEIVTNGIDVIDYWAGKATLLCPLWPNRICSCWSQYYCPL